MDLKTLHSILEIGETVAVEFKRCGNGIESDTYESVCSFLNRFGGDLFLGVLDNGTVTGVPKAMASDIIKNFINVLYHAGESGTESEKPDYSFLLPRDWFGGCARLWDNKTVPLQ